MTNTAILTEWLSIGSLAFTVFRISLVWIAFHGAGTLLKQIEIMRKRFTSAPSIVFGMVMYIVLIFVFSILQILTRTSVLIMILPGAAIGSVVICRSFHTALSRIRFRTRYTLMIVPSLIALYLMISNIMIAGRPEMNFNDTQVTYMVQPDRWLNEGQIHFIDETTFSAFPMISEMLFLLPSSLATDRLDQMVLGQVFSLSMLIALVIASMTILGFRWRWYPAAMISIAGCTCLVLWSHFAKPDATALFFVTISLSMILAFLDRNETGWDYSPFLCMSLALGTKLTAYLALIPFVIMVLLVARKKIPGLGVLASSVLLTSFFPLVFALRTVIHTGTPFFPHFPLAPFLKPKWRMPDIDLTYAVFNDRSSYFFPSVGFMQNIYDYFVRWGSSIFLLLGGYALTLKKRFLRRRSFVLAGIALYACASLVLYYPAWWGAKYGILLIPFAALFGLHLLKDIRHGLAIATTLCILIYFVYDTPLSPTEYYGLNFRLGIIESYIAEDWKAQNLDVLEEQGELKLSLWMNEHLPQDSRLLSLYATKRYFSNHHWLVAWRYPPAARIYLDDTLEDEIELLQELEIDYLVMQYMSPATFDDARSVELLARIGPGDVLEPVIILDTYELLRFNPENYSQ